MFKKSKAKRSAQIVFDIKHDTQITNSNCF